jgi:ankyrin repeat protein
MDSNILCQVTYTKIILYLLYKNKICDVHDLDDAGQSTLHGACKQDNPKMVKLLLKNKFDIDQRLSISITDVNTAATVYQQFNNFFKLCFHVALTKTFTVKNNV